MQLVLDMKRIRKLNPSKSAQIPVRVLMYSGPLPIAVSKKKQKTKTKQKNKCFCFFQVLAFLLYV